MTPIPLARLDLPPPPMECEGVLDGIKSLELARVPPAEMLGMMYPSLRWPFDMAKMAT